MEKTIPAFSSDGRRLRRYTLAAIERLEQLDLVAVERNRRGKIVCVHFRAGAGANPIRNTAHVGTRYSFREKLPNGHCTWAFCGLPSSGHEAAQFVRGVFFEVTSSCLVENPPARTQEKVVSIDTARRAHPGQRPLEFDSELRAA